MNSAPTNLPRAPLLDKILLWEHQKNAIASVRNYRRGYRPADGGKSALVHMPTGTGKTGVIASLARCVPEIGCVLVLSPRIALCEQLYDDIKTEFFAALGFSPKNLPKVVQLLDGNLAGFAREDFDHTIIVGTIQKLLRMSQGKKRDYATLRSKIDLVLVDEGHCEPARSWSDVIRGLNKPTVIFTATPYRNDFKVFNLDPDHMFSFTFNEAIQQRYVREVEFIKREAPPGPEGFVEDVVSCYEKLFGKASAAKPRVIIRCDRHDSIRQIAQQLLARNLSCVAIHEQFEETIERPWERSSVPKPELEKATFWIHQFKLLEGIDDPRFRMLALYQPLNNARSLVQQIGRIIRNPTRESKAVAHVIDHTSGEQESTWNEFLAYDRAIKTQGLALSMGHGIIEKLNENQPKAFYVDGRFRSQLELKTINPEKELLLPLITNLHERDANFAMDDLEAELMAYFEDQDRKFHSFRPNSQTSVFLYVDYANSPYLKTKVFLECSLGITVIREMPNHIAFFDSSGLSLAGFEVPGLGEAVEPKKLRRLFPAKGRNRLTRISLLNTNLGSRSIRSKTFSAASIEDVVTGVDDHMQVCTTAEGYCFQKKGNRQHVIRRYVGFHRGRISQASSNKNSLPRYLEWLDGLAAEIAKNDSRKLIRAFQRFAPEAHTPANPQPKSILFDLFEIQDRYLTVHSPLKGVEADHPLIVEDYCCEVKGGGFGFQANGTPVKAKVSYDGRKQKYYLESPDLDALYKPRNSHDPGLLEFLNAQQSFRVLPETENVFYTQGRFYCPLLKIGVNFVEDEFQLNKVLVPCPTLGKIGSEKGKACLANGAGWQSASLFGLIDTLGKGTELDVHFGTPDIVICDDLGTEAADFILADTKKRIVRFIHAKAKSPPSYCSASNITEVCGQATKNMTYLGMFNEMVPANLNRWGQPWHATGVSGSVAKRIRKGSGSPQQVWEQVRGVLRDPTAVREVWVFTGQILSRGKFISELSNAKPGHEAVQAVYLMQGALADAASVSAQLRIFCAP